MKQDNRRNLEKFIRFENDNIRLHEHAKMNEVSGLKASRTSVIFFFKD